MQRSTWLPSFYQYCIIIIITIVLITGGARQSLTCVLLLVVRKTSTVGLSNLRYTIFVPYTISMIWCQTYDTLHGNTHNIVSNLRYTTYHTIHGVVTIQNKILTNQLYQIYLFEELDLYIYTTYPSIIGTPNRQSSRHCIRLIYIGFNASYGHQAYCN